MLDRSLKLRGHVRIVLGDNVWLGTGAKVLDGVRIGSDVVVGANAVVNADLPDGAVAAGVPARVLRLRQGAEPAGSGSATSSPEAPASPAAAPARRPSICPRARPA